MKNKSSSKSVIFFALSANLFIAAIKLIVAIITGSSAMLAEAIHSFADSANQVFLLVGIKKSEKAPDTLHPFGFSGEVYFWSFIVAIILFTAGGVFSIYEGLHKLLHPKPIENVAYAFVVLILSLIAESIAFYKVRQKINLERQGTPVYEYLRKTKKSELIVVFMEDLAAICGLTTALVLIFLEHITAILVFDGIASVIIGMILCAVALFLGNEIRSLMIGESADPKITRQISTIFEQEESVNRVVFIKSLQLGPDDILIAANVEFNHRLTFIEINNLIDSIEKEIREKTPEVKKIFIEPDLYRKGITE